MRRPGTSARIAWTILVLALLVIVVWLNAMTLIDTYGSGPPFYGRTTKMDKWTDPLPWLLPLDATVIVAAVALTYQSRRNPG